ncbi:MFS general substrate transporter [Cadophora sp. DSE1049]|nr:MFS general substrate transporter [Cadophora sp. DSE1049]
MTGSRDILVIDDGKLDPHLLKVYKRRWFGFVTLALLNLVICWNWVNFAYVGDYVAEWYSTDAATVNWMSTTFLFAGLFGNYPAAVALRRETKHAIVAAAVLSTSGCWLKYGGAKIANIGLTMFGQLILGFSQPFVINTPVFYSETWFRESTRTTATAVSSIPPIFGGVMASLISPAWIHSPTAVAPTSLYIAIITTGVSLVAPFIPAKPPTPPELDTEDHMEKVHWKVDLMKLARSVEFYLVCIPFIVGAALFNLISTILYPVLVPFGFSYVDIGHAGTLIIVVGQGLSLILSPLCDRYKIHIYIIKVSVILSAVSYILLIWVPPSESRSFLFGQCALLSIAIIGPSPINLEFITEILYPLRVEYAISIMWAGGQLLGGCLIIASGYMFDSQGTNMPAVYMCVGLSCAVVPLPLCLGMFGRKGKVTMNRSIHERNLRNEHVLKPTEV